MRREVSRVVVSIMAAVLAAGCSDGGPAGESRTLVVPQPAEVEGLGRSDVFFNGARAELNEASGDIFAETFAFFEEFSDVDRITIDGLQMTSQCAGALVEVPVTETQPLLVLDDDTGIETASLRGRPAWLMILGCDGMRITMD